MHLNTGVDNLYMYDKAMECEMTALPKTHRELRHNYVPGASDKQATHKKRSWHSLRRRWISVSRYGFVNGAAVLFGEKGHRMKMGI